MINEVVQNMMLSLLLSGCFFFFLMNDGVSKYAESGLRGQCGSVRK